MPTVKTLLPQKQADVQLIRVAAYCRVSSDSTEQLQGVERFDRAKGILRGAGGVLHGIDWGQSLLDTC